MKTIEKAKLVQGMSPEKVSASVYDIAINGLDGTPILLSEFRGKKLLFVNVASECGFTRQMNWLSLVHLVINLGSKSREMLRKFSRFVKGTSGLHFF